MIRLTRRAFVQAAAAPLLVGAEQAAGRRWTSPSRTSWTGFGRGGVPWREKTVDGFKAGDPAAALTGVAVTVAARLENLKRAASAGCNLVITQEPVFYGANDDPGNRASDPVYLAKKAYIDQGEARGLAVPDHWSARQPDPRVAALAEALSWKDGAGQRQGIYRIPETPSRR